MEIELNNETIEKLTKKHTLKDLNINSTIKNDDIVLALLLKNKIIKYKCCGKGCKISSNWNNKPFKLLLVRKNNRKKDLRINNLELKCYNCFFQEHNSLELFEKFKNKKVIKCKLCDFIITKQSNKCKNNKLCKICYEKYVTDRVKIKEHKTMWDNIVNENEINDEEIKVNLIDSFVDEEDDEDELIDTIDENTIDFNLNEIGYSNTKEDSIFLENIKDLNNHIENLKKELMDINLIN